MAFFWKIPYYNQPIFRYYNLGFICGKIIMAITIVYGNILAAWTCLMVVTVGIIAYDIITVIVIVYQMPKNTSFIVL